MKEAAKNQKMVAKSSVQLYATLGNTLEMMAGNGRSNSNQVTEGKLIDVMKKVEDKLDEKFNSFLSVMQRRLERKD
jgi:hypothetical protein